jgi:hypothetical protein
MLKPLSNTSYRLNSCNINNDKTFNSKSSKQTGKRVAFSEEGTSPDESIDKAMAKAKQKSTRKRKQSEKTTTPQPKEPDISVIGSSCTWGDTELESYMVTVERDVNVRKMIPEKFFKFDHLKNYKDCPLLSWAHTDD